MSVAAATLVAGTVPASAQGAVQAVPRTGVSFANTITLRARIEVIDPDTRTMSFTANDGRLVSCAIGDSVRNAASIEDGSVAMVTYNEIVTVLNLRQKGPGSQEARREGERPGSVADIDSGRFTLTVVAVDLAGNKVSVIDGRGGEVKTYAASTIATKDMLQKIKVGDVVIGLTTPMLVTSIVPVK